MTYNFAVTFLEMFLLSESYFTVEAQTQISQSSQLMLYVVGWWTHLHGYT